MDGRAEATARPERPPRRRRAVALVLCGPGPSSARSSTRCSSGWTSRAADLDARARWPVRWHEAFAGAGPTADLLAPGVADGTGLLVAGLRAAIRTPLGPLFGGTSLADLDRRDRLDELGVRHAGRAGGAHPVGRRPRRARPRQPAGRPSAPAVGGGVGRRGHRRPARRLPHRFDRPRGPRRATTAADRFVVADYKTNRLTPPGADPGPADYDVRPMADAMARAPLPAPGAAVRRRAPPLSPVAATRPGHRHRRGERRGLPVRAGDDRAEVGR